VCNTISFRAIWIVALFEAVVAVILEISHYEKKSTPEALIEGTPLSGI